MQNIATENALIKHKNLNKLASHCNQGVKHSLAIKTENVTTYIYTYNRVLEKNHSHKYL